MQHRQQRRVQDPDSPGQHFKDPASVALPRTHKRRRRGVLRRSDDAIQTTENHAKKNAFGFKHRLPHRFGLQGERLQWQRAMPFGRLERLLRGCSLLLAFVKLYWFNQSINQSINKV